MSGGNKDMQKLYAHFDKPSTGPPCRAEFWNDIYMRYALREVYEKKNEDSTHPFFESLSVHLSSSSVDTFSCRNHRRLGGDCVIAGAFGGRFGDFQYHTENTSDRVFRQRIVPALSVDRADTTGFHKKKFETFVTL